MTDREIEIRLECLKMASIIKSPRYDYTLMVAKKYYEFIFYTQLGREDIEVYPEHKNQITPP